MIPFRFSPIKDIPELFTTIEYIHRMCHRLVKQSLGVYLPVAGNIGIFSHFDDEYTQLTRIQQTLTDPSDHVYGKYFRIHKPIHVAAYSDIPGATYTHLYIRKPDPGRPQAGDIDFFMESSRYNALKQSLVSGDAIHGARLLPHRPDLDLVEFFDTDIDALSYVGDKKWQ